MSSDLGDLINLGATGNKPSAGIPGRLYFDTTRLMLCRDNGISWDDIGETVEGGGGIPDSGWIAAGETWVYASADDPTYTFTVAGIDLTDKYSAGMRVRLVQSTGGTKYFIITKVTFSTNTTITIYGGTDYDLNDEAISSPYWTTVRAPHGFPLDPIKWSVEVKDTANRTQATPTQNVWYNLGSNSINISIGCWIVYYRVLPVLSDATAGAWEIQTTLSTGNNSETDKDFTCRLVGSSIVVIGSICATQKNLALASKTTYYLNIMTAQTGLDNMYFRGDIGTTILRAVCAYL